MMNFANYSKLSLTILVMDENSHNATFLKQSLVYLGHTVSVFDNAADALDAYKKNPDEFDALITDGEFFTFLPGVAKYNTAKIAKDNEKDFVNAIISIRPLPILVCCLYSSQIDAIKSQLGDAFPIDYLDKSEENSVKHLNTWLNNLDITQSHQEETFPIYQLVYASKAVKDFSEEDLLNILQFSRQNNKKKQITGAMIYSKGYFLQMLEGQRNAVNELFNYHIAKDKRHEMVNCFFKNHVEKREFPEWYMGFFRHEDNEGHDLLELIDFKEHPAGKFFRDKLAETKQNFQGKYPIPPDYQVGNEISWIMEAMCSPSMRLIFDMTHNREVAFETLRLKLGLDCLQTGVILTDVERNIIYINRGAMTLLNAIQRDIQKEMPNFSAEHLIGHKVDFFKNLDQEMHLLTSSNYESITQLSHIGERCLRLTISEFVNECGQKLGFAIELEETHSKNES